MWVPSVARWADTAVALRTFRYARSPIQTGLRITGICSRGERLRQQAAGRQNQRQRIPPTVTWTDGPVADRLVPLVHLVVPGHSHVCGWHRNSPQFQFQSKSEVCILISKALQSQTVATYTDLLPLHPDGEELKSNKGRRAVTVTQMDEEFLQLAKGLHCTVKLIRIKAILFYTVLFNPDGAHQCWDFATNPQSCGSLSTNN